MARAKSETVVTQSVLDRLISSQNEEWSMTRAQSLRLFKDSLKRDLEWLLNTRRPPIENLRDYELASTSVLNYGLPDMSAMSVFSSEDQFTLLAALQECLRNYEPRISGLRVYLEGAEVGSRSIRFRIEGMLRIDHAPEEVNFDTVLEVGRGEYQVK
jgi:type VI secretion system protein ImpF